MGSEALSRVAPGLAPRRMPEQILPVPLINTNVLWASLLWGSVGIGYFVYGKKQSSLAAMLGGVSMIVASYFVGSVWLMSLVSLGLMVTVYMLVKRGW